MRNAALCAALMALCVPGMAQTIRVDAAAEHVTNVIRPTEALRDAGGRGRGGGVRRAPTVPPGEALERRPDRLRRRLEVLGLALAEICDLQPGGRAARPVVVERRRNRLDAKAEQFGAYERIQ